MFECAVINAGPLVALSLLEQLELLPALYAQCWVPQTVFNEVAVAGLGKPGAKSLQSADWLQPRGCRAKKATNSSRGSRLKSGSWTCRIRGQVLIQSRKTGAVARADPVTPWEFRHAKRSLLLHRYCFDSCLRTFYEG